MSNRSPRRLAAVALAVFCCLAGTASAQVDQSKDIVVISGQYPGSAAPLMDDVTWADYYQRKVGGFYASSTGFHNGTAPVGRSLWRFRPASSFGGLAFHSFNFAWRDYGSGDQSEIENVITREGLDAVASFDAAHPGLIDLGLRNFVVMANLPNRGRANPFTPYVTMLGNFVIIGVTVFDEPVNSAVQSGEIVVGGMVVNLDTAATCAHELGHLLALPDLYSEDQSDDFVGDWCVMATGDFVHFSGWSRAIKGWTPSARIAVPARPAPGTTGITTIRIFPPMTPSATNRVEVVMIPTDESLADFSPTLASFLSAIGVTKPGWYGFYGYVLEVRNHTGADATSTSVLVDGTAMNTTPETGQSAAARNGVLISYAQAGFTARHRPFNPLDVQRLPAGESLQDAPFTVGETFTDAVRGVTATVLSANADGSFDVRITWTVPPRPALTVRDAWIDSPGNAFGSFLFGGSAVAANPPPLSGDSIFVPTTVVWRQGAFGIPYPTLAFAPTPHRVQFRVRNSGRIGISNTFSGKVAILEPQLVPPLAGLGNDPFAAVMNLLNALNPLTVIDFGTANVAIVTGNGDGVLDPGEEANVTVLHSPNAPFMASIFVDGVRSVPTAVTAAQPEPVEAMIDNWIVEPFVVLTTFPGSPFQVRTFSFPVTNIDAKRRFITMAFEGLPPVADPQVPAKNWRLKLNPPFASLPLGESQRFELSVQPPDPPDFKGGTETIAALGFMNHLDSVIPIDRLDVHVVAAARSMLTVEMDGKGTVRGQLSYRTITGNDVANAPAGLPIYLTVSGSDGVTVTYVPGEPGHGAITQADGRYLQAAPPSFQLRSGVRYHVVADWMGNENIVPARAEATFDNPKSEGGADCVPSAITLLGRPPRPWVHVKNAGNGNVRGAKLQLLWSKDEFPSKDDRPAGEAAISAIGAGRSKLVRVELAGAFEAGDGYLLAVCVPKKASDDRNELNNAVALRWPR